MLSDGLAKHRNASVASVLKNLEHELEYELHPIDTVEPCNKIILAIIVAINLGFCGCDRCLFGQFGLGCLKCLTCGGCGCWWLIDTIVLSINIVLANNSIDMLGMRAVFDRHTVQPALFVWLILWAMNSLTAGWSNQHSHFSEARSFARRKTGDNRVIGPPSAREIRALFKKFDMDGNGTLDHDELQEALRYVGVPADRFLIYEKLIDTNNDGKVGIMEFAAAIEKGGIAPRS